MAKLELKDLDNDTLDELEGVGGDISKLSDSTLAKMESIGQRKNRAPMPELESGLRGALSGATFGFADEAAGAIGAAGEALKKLSLDDLKANYEASKSEFLDKQKQAERDNPLSYIAGNVAGGFATPIPFAGAARGLGTIGKMALTGAASGAIQGLGESEGPIGENLTDTLKGAALGGSLSGGLGAIGKGLGAAASGIKTAVSGASRGAAGASGGGTLDRLIGAVKGIGEERAIQGIDESKLSTGILTPEVEKVAELATSRPNKMNKEDIAYFLSKTPEERLALRNFSAQDAATELTPLLEKAEKEYWGAVRGASANLTKKAGEEFDYKKVIPVNASIRNAIAEVQKKPQLYSTATVNSLNEIKDIIVKGIAPETAGLTEGMATKVSGEEIAKRVSYARQRLRDFKEVAKKDYLNNDAGLMSKIFDTTNEVMKSSPFKKLGDEIYAKGMSFKDSVFDVLRFGDSYGLDKQKVAGMLKDKDTSRRFFEEVQKYKDYAAQYSENFQPSDAVNIALEKLDRFKKIADDARRLDKAERLAGGSAKTGLSATLNNILYASEPERNKLAAVLSPFEYMNMIEQNAKKVIEAAPAQDADKITKALAKARLYLKNAANPDMQAAGRLMISSGLPRAFVSQVLGE